MFDTLLLLANSQGPSTSHAWKVYLASALLIVGCIYIHDKVIRLLIHMFASRGSRRPALVLVPMLFLVVAHLVEISLFGLGYAVLIHQADVGTLVGQDQYRLLDYFYFSGVTYTTVGYGDLVPEGALRTFAVIESLCGLMLVTWSASFTFMIMSRIWREEAASRKPGVHEDKEANTS